jgi:hypothetical protein
VEVAFFVYDFVALVLDGKKIVLGFVEILLPDGDLSAVV